MIGEIGHAEATWKNVAAEVGARPAEVKRVASTFEHDDLERARSL